MFDCSKEMTGFHDKEVTLPNTARTQMRDHRDANRKRLRSGLTKVEKPLPKNFHSQGSYAMKTMVQHDDNKYDIDDGVYFDKEQLVGDRGAELSALATRQMVRDAVDDGCFKTPPEVRKNCVRVFYEAGYHVDLPVYRKIEEKNWLGDVKIYFELASVNWKRSDAREVTAWFEDENTKQSLADDPDQLRRICRLLKKYSTSRPSWCSQATSGFVITKLVTERFRPSRLRDDKALLDTMKAIKSRLDWTLEVDHPVTPNEKLSKGADDTKISFFRDRLGDAIKWLEPVEKNDCTREDARNAWDKTFNTEYFASCAVPEESTSASKSATFLTAAVAAASVLGAMSAKKAGAAPVNKGGSNRYA